MEGEGTALALVPVYVGGLDPTMARSVAAYLETRQSERFSVTDRAAAAILLVDIDQPGAADEAAGSRNDQIVVGVGFGRTPDAVPCRHYVQKPLTGNVLLDALSDVVPLLGSSPSSATPTRRTAVGRASHARDVFTTGRPYLPQSRRDTSPDRDQDRPQRALADRVASVRAVHLPTRMTDVVDASGPSTAAERLAGRLDVEAVPVRDHGDLSDPAVLASFRYDSEAHLDGLLRRAVRDGGNRHWELRGPMLSVLADPAESTLWVSGGDTVLRALCAQPAGDPWSLEIHRQPPSPAGRRRATVESLLWNTAVWSSQGRIPVTMDPDVAVAVRAWPDLTRCVLTPSVLAVTALLAAGPQRPADVSTLLAIPRSHAFVVLAALDASGLLEGAAEPAATPPEPPTVHAERGLLRRFLARLRDA
ncbi:MAG TPA: hypothetical protein PKE56_15440 [Acidimicrobiales bacterium]|jgi:hypothetical protein|nr:hypothetical protein [Acidimicrobiales bacterium]